MDLEALGNIGDFLGGIGVVITLLYLAIQIRQNTRQMRLDSAAARTTALEDTTMGINRWIERITSNKDLADVWRRGLEDPGQLDEADMLRFQYMSTQLMLTWQISFRRTQHLEDDELWAYNRLYIKMYLRSPGFQTIWAGTRSLMTPPFAAEVDELASKIGSST
jgi:hypothetical protein